MFVHTTLTSDPHPAKVRSDYVHRPDQRLKVVVYVVKVRSDYVHRPDQTKWWKSEATMCIDQIRPNQRVNDTLGRPPIRL